MSILANRAKSVNNMPVDGIYVIYGLQGTGKTVLASTFPKTEEKPMLYLDFLEGGTGSISVNERDFISVVEINSFDELDEVLNSQDISKFLSFISAFPNDGEFLREFPLNVNMPSISEYLF